MTKSQKASFYEVVKENPKPNNETVDSWGAGEVNAFLQVNSSVEDIFNAKCKEYKDNYGEDMPPKLKPGVKKIAIKEYVEADQQPKIGEYKLSGTDYLRAKMQALSKGVQEISPQFNLTQKQANKVVNGEITQAEAIKENDPFTDCEIKPDTATAEIDKMLLVGDNILFTRRNISVIGGKTGVGKSALITAICHAILNGNETLRTTKSDYSILIIDTEQDSADVKNMLNRINKLNGKNPTDQIPNIRAISVLEYDFEARQEKTEQCIAYMRPDFVFLDGLAELFPDTNNELMANLASTWSQQIAKKYDCHLMSVMHEIPSQSGVLTKLRGHLGSQIERKIETRLSISKVNQNSRKVEYPKTRRKTPAPFCFYWDSNGLPIIAGMVDVDVDQMEKLTKDQMRAIDFWQSYNDQSEPVSHASIINEIKAQFNTSDATAKRVLKELINRNLFEKTSSGLYQILVGFNGV